MITPSKTLNQTQNQGKSAIHVTGKRNKSDIPICPGSECHRKAKRETGRSKGERWGADGVHSMDKRREREREMREGMRTE
jgi:hypothetical protein